MQKDVDQEPGWALLLKRKQRKSGVSNSCDLTVSGRGRGRGSMTLVFNRNSLYFITSVFSHIYCWYLYWLFLQLNFTALGCGGHDFFYVFVRFMVNISRKVDPVPDSNMEPLS